jgi:hypothetical protein
MRPLTLMQKINQLVSFVKSLGLYKLFFSEKVAFCFVLLFISTGIVVFSAWAVCKHIIDSGTFGAVVATFGGIAATLASVYNIVHGMNDRAAMQVPTTTTTITVDPSLPPQGTL